MDQYLIKEDLEFFLKQKEFLYIATSNADSSPNVAPKFLIKAERDFIYLADFVFGKTYSNLKSRPKVSLSVINLNDLTGYQINGSAKLIEQGAEFDGIVADLQKRAIHFSVKRFVEGMKQEKKTENLEMAFPDRLVVIKVTVEEIARITREGEVKREQKA